MTDTDKKLYAEVRKAFADQGNAMIKKGVPFRVILTALADISLQMAIKLEKSGDSAATLKRLQDHLALRLEDWRNMFGRRRRSIKAQSLAQNAHAAPFRSRRRLLPAAHCCPAE